MTNIKQANLTNQITKVIIENFQSHSKSENRPGSQWAADCYSRPKQTRENGDIQSIAVAFYNSPDGDDFIRWGATFARVTAEYADGTQVVRYRTKGGLNRYMVRKPGQLEQTYEGFGRGAVPLEVQEITGVSPVEIGEGLTLNLNLAEQLDGPFLGNKAVSSTARAKVLGKLAGTEEVDMAGKQLGTDLYRWRQEEKRLDGDAANLQEQLKQFDYLPEFKEKLARLMVIRNQVSWAISRRQELDRLRTAFINCQYDLNECDAMKNHWDDIIESAGPWMIAAEVNIHRESILRKISEERPAIASALNAAGAVVKETEGLGQAGEIIGALQVNVERRFFVDKMKVQLFMAGFDLTGAKIILRNTKGIPAAGEALKQVETNLSRMDSFKLLRMVLKANKVSREAANLILEQTKGVAGADEALKLAEKNLSRVSFFKTCHKAMEYNRDDLSAARVAWVKAQDAMDAEGLVLSLDGMVNRKTNLTQLKKFIESKELTKTAYKQDIESLAEEIMRQENDYYQILKEAGRCPMCGGEINKENLKEVI